MPALTRTDSQNPDFVALVKHLDADLAEKDGANNLFYAQFNKIDAIRHAVVAYETDSPVGCGAMKQHDPATMEIKRMYTVPARRGTGVAAAILAELERWATEQGYVRCVLETGQRQPVAIRLYHKQGYRRIPNYGQYAGVNNSLCFEKELIG